MTRTEQLAAEVAELKRRNATQAVKIEELNRTNLWRRKEGGE